MDNSFRSPNIRKATKRALTKKKLQEEGKLKNKSNDEIEELITHEVALAHTFTWGMPNTIPSSKILYKCICYATVEILFELFEK